MADFDWLGQACDCLRDRGLDEAAGFLESVARVRVLAASEVDGDRRFTVVRYHARDGETVYFREVRSAPMEPPGSRHEAIEEEVRRLLAALRLPPGLPPGAPIDAC